MTVNCIFKFLKDTNQSYVGQQLQITTTSTSTTTTTTAYNIGNWETKKQEMNGLDEDHITKMLNTIDNHQQLHQIAWIAKGKLEELKVNSHWVVWAGKYKFGMAKPFNCRKEITFKKMDLFIYCCNM